MPFTLTQIKMSMMKNSSNKLLIVIALLCACQIYAQQESIKSSEKNVLPEDLKMLLGDWSGSLTYMDYSSDKPYTMPANLKVKHGKNKYQFTLLFMYPNEPKANSKGKIMVSKNGEELNKKSVKSKQVLPNGQIQITTEYDGKDNNKNALIRNLYVLGSHQFVIKKEVKFKNSDEWLMRNEYHFER